MTEAQKWRKINELSTKEETLKKVLTEEVKFLFTLMESGATKKITMEYGTMLKSRSDEISKLGKEIHDLYLNTTTK